MKGRFRPVKALMILVCVAAFLALFSFIVMWLWNAILPAVLGVNIITFWQALGILVLSKILFGFGGGWHHKKQEWKRNMREKWHNMTPEEREKFKAEMKDRCSMWRGRFRDRDRSANAEDSL